MTPRDTAAAHGRRRNPAGPEGRAGHHPRVTPPPDEPLAGPDLVVRHLVRLGLDPAGTPTPVELQRAHVRAITYENLDVTLGREIRLDLPGLAGKLLDRRRGGYCYEQNTLFAAVLEARGVGLTRCLGRVRIGDPTAPRPATHMVLLVDGQVVDVGFGAATPLGPVPLGGEASYGGWTWRTARAVTPEGEDAWQMWLSDVLLYTFTDEPRHPVDYIAPNHYSSTHPRSVFTGPPIVQLSEEERQTILLGRTLIERFPDGGERVREVVPGDYATLLREGFGLALDDDEVARLLAAIPPEP